VCTILLTATCHCRPPHTCSPFPAIDPGKPGAFKPQTIINTLEPHCCVDSRYDTVSKLGISSGKQHLQTTFPDGIALETAFVNSTVVHQLDASAEDAAASGSWCDLQALLPPALTHDDITLLLEHCSVMQTSGKQVILCISCITLSCWWLVLTQGGRLYCAAAAGLLEGALSCCAADIMQC